MTVRELREMLTTLIEQGHGNKEVKLEICINQNDVMETDWRPVTDCIFAGDDCVELYTDGD